MSNSQDFPKLPIDIGADARAMAEVMFGAGITIKDATFHGDDRSSGVYSSGLAVSPGAVPADAGVILSTGFAQSFTNGSLDLVAKADGTVQEGKNYNTRENTSGKTDGFDGDITLNTVAGVKTFDGAALEATFIPLGNTLTMQLTFSSEEYLEWVDAGFNDAVAITVNGVVAEMSIGDGEISIDNINTKSNSNLFHSNGKDLFNTEMDGLTRVLTIKAPVVVGEENTIRVAIADAGDDIYDSNLLIVADSIQTALIANDDVLAVAAKNSAWINLLANDTQLGVDGVEVVALCDKPLAVGESMTLASGEKVTLFEDGLIRVDGLDTAGSNTFTYTIRSKDGTTDSAFVTIATSPVDGTAGNDHMLLGYVDAEGNMIDGADGETDVVLGYGGDDKIFAEAGDDEIYGGAGNDFIRAGAGNDEIIGGDGRDVLDGGVGADVMRGGQGDDIYYIDNSGDVVDESDGSGRDKVKSTLDHTLKAAFEDIWLIEGSDATSATGNASDNEVVGNSNDNVLLGLGGDDIIIGGAGDDRIEGGDGNDKMHGGDGVDEIKGGAGNDKLHGGTGGDTVYGGDGDDILCPGAGDDVLYGGAGNDLLSGNAGADISYGGTGNDTYKINDIGDQVIEFADEGIDWVNSKVSFTLGDNVEHLRLTGSNQSNATGNDLDNTLIGNGSANEITGLKGRDSLSGRGGDDVIEGNEGRDTLNGGAGSDVLSGGDGKDKLRGGAGDDTLEGGAGNDRLYGQNGADTFVFSAGGGHDMIGDFTMGEDTLLFDGLSKDDIVWEQRDNFAVAMIGDDEIALKGVEVEDMSGALLFA
ncbi:MAG: choice-of-anchor L domain-containing protein [Pseudomonadota bacterium]